LDSPPNPPTRQSRRGRRSAQAKWITSNPTSSFFPRAIPRKKLEPQDVLLIVEIADSSLRYDMNQKSLIYAGLGIREFWVIDAVKGATHVFLEPSADGYKVLRNYSSSDLVTPVFAPPAFALRLEDLEQSK
jgi:Uma2 family endonuclease